MAESKAQHIEHFANTIGNFEKILFGKTLSDRRHKAINDDRFIIKCIGRIRSQWTAASYGYGTGTAFEYDAKTRRIFVLTCAHNVAREDEGKMEMPERVYFERRQNAANGSILIKEYECDRYTAHEEYSFKDQCPNDLAIISFIVPEDDIFYDKLFDDTDDTIQLKSSKTATSSTTFHIYGFPCNKSKYSKVINGELWGMEGKSKSYDAVNKVELYVRTNADKNQYFYNSIDTEPGQSGSGIFVSAVANGTIAYNIVGVHTGGSIKKHGPKNWGIALNKSKIKWLQQTKTKMTTTSYDNSVEIAALHKTAMTTANPILGGVVDVGVSTYRFYKGDSSTNEYGKEISTTAIINITETGGALGGAAIGTCIAGPIGTVIGATVGGIVMSFIGNKSAKTVSKKLFQDN